ncbi:MAG: tRNA (guanosine(46)-N7)-methyltransferase TrmB [Gammaproteobacteria bacterium]|nr:tRNA (guanosine(46)-N7)-methyltransferase TrmB [Gammaproteobacteria bacterium]
MNNHIKSFVIRNGRCGIRQNQAYLYHLGHFSLSAHTHPWSFERIFDRDADTIIEIGFGMGQSLIQMAEMMPEKNFIGVEVHRPGIGQLLAEVHHRGLKNVRLIPFDAVRAFLHYVPKNSLAGIQIYFPDPWPKKRHHKRRLVQTAFIELLSSCLRPGGYLHCATDWEPYAQWMLEQIASCQHLVNQSLDNTFVPKPLWRPETKFERRGIGLGHGVYDLLYVKS